jgi:hypothetical protein
MVVMVPAIFHARPSPSSTTVSGLVDHEVVVSCAAFRARNFMIDSMGDDLIRPEPATPSKRPQTRGPRRKASGPTTANRMTRNGPLLEERHSAVLSGC